jgi:hypothetical protein
MSERRAARTGRTARAVRGLWPDHNPLRRSSDRAEAVIVVLLVAVSLIGAPLIALITWRLTFNGTFSTTDAAAAGWRQTSAVLLADEPGWTGGYGSLVPVSWAAPDGVRHTGQFLADPGARAGTRVTVWTDASGHLTETPMSPRQAAAQADLAAAIAVPVWALTMVCAGMACHHVLDRRRLAAWDADWRTLNLSGPAGASPDR